LPTGATFVVILTYDPNILVSDTDMIEFEIGGEIVPY